MKKLTKIIFLVLFSVKCYAVGTPVFDETSYFAAVQQLGALQQMIEYNVQMAKNVGDGKFTPATINWAADWYKKCGGRTLTLPDWFPKPNLSICADDSATAKIGVEWYKKEFLVLSTDSPAEIKRKQQNAKDNSVKIRAWALAQSVKNLSRGKEDKEVIDKLQNGLNTAGDQISVAKMQTQVMINMLTEQQKTNENLAMIIHIMSTKP
ncbi:MAG: hypothetical protein LBQ34_00385 [Alphaproteobacteria bacterium]|jgi:hypothetical protein|nr:hypothetical protein [Alphaproteobacteria bacterium]